MEQIGEYDLHAEDEQCENGRKRMGEEEAVDILLWLQTWFAENCVEDWQHFYGIKIGTLDNPGWHIDIDLRETQAENKPFQEVKQDLESDSDWLHCKVANNIFSGSCSPKHLITVLELFKNWVEE